MRLKRNAGYRGNKEPSNLGMHIYSHKRIKRIVSATSCIKNEK